MRFRDTNIETIDLINASMGFDGVLINDNGEVVSTWSSFAYQSGNDGGQINRGINAGVVVDLIDIVQNELPLYSLEVEMNYAPLFAARKLGLDEEWLGRLEAQNSQDRRVLRVSRIVADTPAAQEFKNGDMILAIDGQIVTSFRELEKAVQKQQVEVTLWRDDEARNVKIETVALSGSGIDRAVSWAGALLQDPHRGMAAQRGVDPTGVYVAFFSYGSPATRYGLWAGRRIVQVDDIEVPDLQAFIDVVKDKGDQTSVRLKTITWNGAVEVITLKLDNQYWPAYEIKKNKDGWYRASIG
jgi:S1-C subfamily serine protease